MRPGLFSHWLELCLIDWALGHKESRVYILQWNLLAHAIGRFYINCLFLAITPNKLFLLNL